MTSLNGSNPNPRANHAVPQPGGPVAEVDERGDYIFRFALNAEGVRPDLALEDYFRETLLDLLRLVRFYSNGRPVIVDEFSLANDPAKRISLRVESRPSTGGSGTDRT